MPSKIEARIDRIRAILVDLKLALVQEQERANALEVELNKANERLAKVQVQNTDLTNQLIAMNDTLSTNQQDIIHSTPELSHRREEEIDALVKEIEFCIRQLKDKNA
jgi:predicted  nucleic acid-binding Zn-ribbon protein